MERQRDVGRKPEAEAPPHLTSFIPFLVFRLRDRQTKRDVSETVRGAGGSGETAKRGLGMEGTQAQASTLTSLWTRSPP